MGFSLWVLMRLIGFEKKNKRERRYGGYWDFFIIKRRGRERG